MAIRSKYQRTPWKPRRNPIETSQTYHGNPTGIQQKSYSNCKYIPQQYHRNAIEIPKKPHENQKKSFRNPIQQKSHRNCIEIQETYHGNPIGNPKKSRRTTIRMAIGIPQKLHEHLIEIPQESHGHTMKRLQKSLSIPIGVLLKSDSQNLVEISWTSQRIPVEIPQESNGVEIPYATFLESRRTSQKHYRIFMELRWTSHLGESFGTSMVFLLVQFL